MAYSPKEQGNLDTVRRALDDARDDFAIFFEQKLVDDVEWTIAGHGPVAGTYHGIKDLWENAEKALYDRLTEKLRIEVVGLWADDDQIFARIKSSSRASDGKPYNNEYMYIMTVRDGRVVSGIEWLNLHAYYDVVNRITL